MFLHNVHRTAIWFPILIFRRCKNNSSAGMVPKKCWRSRSFPQLQRGTDRWQKTCGIVSHLLSAMNKSKKTLMITNMFKHLHETTRSKESSGSGIYIRSDHLQVEKLSFLCLSHDILTLRIRIGNRGNLGLGEVFCHP